MTPAAAIRIGAALVLALGAHLALLHALRAPAPAVQIQGAAVSFEIGGLAAPGEAAADGRSDANPLPDDAGPEPTRADDAPADPESQPGPELSISGREAPEPEMSPVEPPLTQPDAPADDTSPAEVEPGPLSILPVEETRGAPAADDEPHTNEDAAASVPLRSELNAEALQSDAGGAVGGAAMNSVQRGAAGGSAEREQTSDQVGNAVSANYAGEVLFHLSQVRRPRAPGPGSAFIRFTIGPSGDLERVEIAASSGSSRFDRDALLMVQRAAPFPEPPSGVNRNFTVEIEGS